MIDGLAGVAVLDTLVRCSRNQVSNAPTNGRLHSVRTSTRRGDATRPHIGDTPNRCLLP